MPSVVSIRIKSHTMLIYANHAIPAAVIPWQKPLELLVDGTRLCTKYRSSSCKELRHPCRIKREITVGIISGDEDDWTLALSVLENRKEIFALPDFHCSWSRCQRQYTVEPLPVIGLEEERNDPRSRW